MKPKQNANRLEKRLAMADTGSVTNSMGSHNAAMGRMRGPQDRRKNSTNDMVSGNANRVAGGGKSRGS